MIKHFAASALAGVLLLAGIGQASAWDRSSAITTARGTRTSHRSASCGDGTCTRSRTVTGAEGRTISRTGTVSKTAPGQVDYARTTTGPAGGSVTRSGAVTRTPASP
jgi:hypothetical protein